MQRWCHIKFKHVPNGINLHFINWITPVYLFFLLQCGWPIDCRYHHELKTSRCLFFFSKQTKFLLSFINQLNVWYLRYLFFYIGTTNNNYVSWQTNYNHCFLLAHIRFITNTSKNNHIIMIICDSIVKLVVILIH